MKRVILLCIFSFIASAANAQAIVQFGAKAGGLNTWILNSQIMSGTGDTSYSTSFGYTAGINLGIYANNRTYYSHKLKGGLLELNYTGVNQGYRNKSTLFKPYKHSIGLGYLDVGLFFHTLPSSDDGFYFQIGPQFSFLMGARAKSDAIKDSTGTTLVYSYVGKDARSSYSGTNMQLVMEMGKILSSRKTPSTIYHIGFRVSYGFNDITRPLRNVVSTGPYSRSNIAYFGLVVGVYFKKHNYYN